MKKQGKIKSIIEQIRSLYNNFRIKIDKINEKQLNIYQNIEKRKTKEKIKLTRNKIKKHGC
ncbi:hypothetical protein K8R66_04020 [bacterium]|nr:hypothetical protein [bacterium]